MDMKELDTLELKVRKGREILNQIEPLYEAHNTIKDRFHSGSVFNLHEKYFDKAFVQSINDQIDIYIKRKIEKLEKEFEDI